MENNLVIDLDANATTAMLPEVVDAMLPWLAGNHANPSSSYKTARLARNAINDSRAQVAELIGASPEEIVFTGSGTESVNTALYSLDKLAGEGAILVSTIEHSAVLRFAESRKRRVKYIPVHADGIIDLDSFRENCDGAGYVSLMLANNETGVIQPLSAAVEIAKKHSLPIHTDAIQAVGKIPVNAKDLGIDMLSISAHKFHGPKGIGAIYIRNGLDFTAMIHGGGQEINRRSGTENTAAIVAMGAAAQLAKESLESAIPGRIKLMRDSFENFLLEHVSGCGRNGNADFRLPNTSHLSFAGCDSAGLLILLDESGVACSAGSACMSGKQKPSHVQLAMGIPEKSAKTSLRFSFSRINSLDQAMEAAGKVKMAVEKLRSVQGSGLGPVVVYTD
ncbi:MAG: cysteine desulfurase [Armatimonadetes bacterium]|nr:cysteine desulfurase [Akkermansiaceae bacterium]